MAYAYNPDGTFEKYGYDQARNLASAADFSAAGGGQSSSQLRAESFGYDADGNQTSATDWDGHTTSYAYNAVGELTSQTVPVTSSSSITTGYGYDAAGNRTSVTSGAGHTTWTTFNSWNLPESVVEPVTAAAPSTGDTTWTTAYDADGRPERVTEPGGVSLSYGYDPLGDITSETGTGASASTPDRSFTYDTDGRMKTAPAPGGTDSFDYYATGTLKSASGPSGTSSYTYNDDGLVSSETDAAGTASYTYDPAGRPATESDPLTGSTLTWGYNADDSPVSVSYTAGGTAGASESFGYDPLQRLTSDTLSSASGTTLASEAYGYDSNGNLTSQSTGGLLHASSQAYAYDEANRLVSATADGSTVSYGYDADGNLTTDGPVTSTYNAQDQLMSASAGGSGATGYTYALNGTLASVTPPEASAQDYTFDAYGNLATAPGGVSYAYDGLDRMVNRTAGSGTTSLSYLGSSDSIASDGPDLYSYDPSGTLTAEGPASGGPGYAVMSDQHGDVSAAFNPAAGTEALEGSASYSPYGTPSPSGSMPAAGYQGDYTDPGTGLVYMNARWYNHATGAFTSNDTLNGAPVPSTVDGNPYAYAYGNPLTLTDPTGHGCGVLWIHCVESGLAVAGRGVVRAAAPVVEDMVEGATDGAECGPDCMAAGAGLGLLFAAGTGLYGLYRWMSSSSSGSSSPQPSRSTGPTGGYLPPWGWGNLGPYPPYSPPAAHPGRSGHTYPVRYTATGYAPPAGCAADCYAPPPPPPPPQDCYAAGTCTPPPPPASLKNDQLITHIVTDITSITQLFKNGHGITEHAAAANGPVTGLTPASSTPSGIGILQQVRQQVLKLAAGGAGAGNRGGVPAPPAAGGACPSPPGSGTATPPDPFLPGSGQDKNTVGGGQSFTPGTRVLLPGGKTAPISSLRPGDKVTARDTRTGKDQTETVTAVEVHRDTDLYDLTVKTSRGTEVIHTTAGHLFWDPYHHYQVAANKLSKGEHLKTPDGSIVVADGGTTPKVHDGWMWDLTVPGNSDHDFYVETAYVAVLVHNDNGPGCDPVTGSGNSGDETLPPRAKVFPLADDDPQALVDPENWLKSGDDLTKGAGYHYVVMENGELRAAENSYTGEFGGHTSLSYGENVLMAGRFEVDDTGNISIFGNRSGHYLPEDYPGFTSLEKVARAAFGRFGLSGQIADAAWDPW